MAKAKSKVSLFNTEANTEMQEGDMNPPAEVEATVEKETNAPTAPASPETAIPSIDLSAIAKKKFHINGDTSKVLELNTSDLSIGTRLDIAYKRLNSLMDDVGEILTKIPDDADDISDEAYEQLSNALKMLDSKMREQVDYLFDSNVSEVCAPFGSMWDPIEGQFRFEHIIDALTKLYESNLNSEFMKMKAKVNRRTAQYTKKHKH